MAAWISARDRRRAGHRVGQPDVERDLRRLAGGADEEQQRDERRPPARPRTSCPSSACACSRELAEDDASPWPARVERPEEQEDAEDEAEVADAVDDEGLVAGGRVRPARVYQKPISAQEQKPTPSQPTNISSRLSPSTSVSIAKVKRFR